MRGLGPATILPFSLAIGVLLFALPSFAASEPDLKEIVNRSVQVNDADWRAQPEYIHHEADSTRKISSDGQAGAAEEKTYRVLMIEGSPYSELIAVNGEPLSASQKRQEQAKLNAEVTKRLSESQRARAERIQSFKKERSEERMLLHEMVTAFRFTLAGQGLVDGHDCYILDANPDANYTPPVMKARVLKGMKGRLWIDKASYHWAKVEASVFQPVEFGLFLAKVQPGTEFTLEQAPITNALWLPKHFSETVNARVLGFYGIRSKRDEYYSNYQRTESASSIRQ